MCCQCKVLFFSLLVICLQVNAATVQQVTGVSDTAFIKSVTSDLCHSPSSSYRSRLTLLDDKSNVFDSLEECLASGGKLSETMMRELKLEDPMAEEEAIKSQEKAELLRVEEKITKAEESKTNESNTKFAGINWGLGLAFTKLDISAVDDVSIEDKTIRVNSTSKNRAVALVESHYFFGDGKDWWGHGPYMAIGLIAEDGIDPLSTYGLGYMLGFKNRDGTSWNIGFGKYVNTGVPRLRDGLKDGGTTDETDPSKLLTKEDESGNMFLFSANF